MKEMKKRMGLSLVARSLVLLMFFFEASLAQATRTFTGTITGKTDDQITITFEDDWAPATGDPVSITWELGGRKLDGGKAEVVSVEGGTIIAKILEGKPNLNMSVEIVSAQPIPLNLDPEALFKHAFSEYSKGFEEIDPMTWARGPEGDGNMDDFVPMFQQAADSGIPEAHYLLASHYYMLRTADRWNPVDTWDDQIREHLIDAAEGGVAEAQYRVGLNFKMGWSGFENNDDEARFWLMKAVDQGHLDAKFEASSVLLVEDPDRSLALLEEAAEAGHGLALRMVGDRLLDYEIDGQVQLKKAIRWYEKWAETGDREPMIRLGDLYLNGGDVYPTHEQTLARLKIDNRVTSLYSKQKRRYDSMRMPADVAKAHYWYTKSLESEHPTKPLAAHQRLGMLYASRNLGFFNAAKAMEHYQKGAELDYSLCMVFLARNYREGILTARNPQLAFKWAKKAAELSSENGKVELAICHFTGTGTSVNYSEAYRIFKEVERFRNVRALLYLGDMYTHGVGIRSDIPKAVDYFKKATKTSGSLFVYENEEVYKSMAYSRLAGLYFQSSPFDAMNFAAAALELDPNNAEAYRNGALGMLHPSWEKRAEKEGYHALAFQNLNRAVELGDLVAHYYLGECYRKGIGVKKSRKQAKIHYRKAAQAGIQEANEYL
jgi:TPR repeat protein